eukprot:8838143-Karenia_brevis.AAC.1
MDVEEIDKLEKETGKSGENELNIMFTQIYTKRWKGSKEATIQASMAQAQVEEMPAPLRFASAVPELPTVPEWPVESAPPAPGVEEGGASASASA